MKVYMIYAKPTDIRPGSDDLDDGTLELYAVTNNKKLFNSFKESRDMTKFSLNKMELEKDNYRKLANHHRDCVLEWCGFRSKKADPYPKDMNQSFGNCVDEYKFAITFLEKQSVAEACDTFFEHVELLLPNPYIFNWKLKITLKRMGLDYIYKLTNFPYIGDDIMYCSDEEIDRRITKQKMSYQELAFLQNDMDFSMPDVWVDQLEVFLSIYGHLMNA